MEHANVSRLWIYTALVSQDWDAATIQYTQETAGENPDQDEFAIKNYNHIRRSTGYKLWVMKISSMELDIRSYGGIFLENKQV